MKKQMILTAVLLGISVLLGAGTWFFGTRPLQQETEELQALAEESQQEANFKEDDRRDTLDGQGMVDAAVAKGKAVLEAWEAFRPTISSFDGITDAEQMQTALEEQRTLGDAIRANFAEDANIVIPWYVDNGTVGSNWKMETPYTFDNHGVNCVFTCKSDAGELLAYVITYYDAEQDVFTSFHEIVTSAGNRHTEATASEDGEDDDSVNQILDWAESNQVDPGRDMTEEEKVSREEMIATRELQQEMYANGYIDNTGKLTKEGRKWVKQHPDEAGPWADQVENTEGGNAE